LLFFKSTYPIQLPRMFNDLIGSEKSKIATTKPELTSIKTPPLKQEISISHLDNLYRQYPRFLGRIAGRNPREFRSISGNVENLEWWSVTGSKKNVTFLSASIHDSNGTPMAIPMFSGLSNKTRLLYGLPEMWISINQRWRILISG
jgi:hypothetical protein